jgi:predicted acyl esterase
VQEAVALRPPLLLLLLLPPHSPSFPAAGWYDIFQEGNLAAWNGANKLSDPSVRGQSKLVVDPCGHCQAAADLFPHDLIFGRVLLPILMAFDMMSNESPTNKTWPPVPEGAKPVTFYVMGDDQNGAPGNFWTSVDDFPAPARTPYYLLAGGAGPGSGALAPQRAGAGAAALSFSADPSDPVHTIGGNNLLIPCGPLDQRPIEALGRQDVLIFTAPPLTEALAVVGLVTATLHFSTDVVDTDFVVKLVDVYPSPDPANPALAGESILVADGIARARWREFPATDEPQLLSGAPGDVYTVHVSLWSTAYVFAPGHSVRVHVQPSNYPRFFPNDNTGTPMSKVSPSTPNVTAHTTLYANATLASAVVLPVVPLSALPPFDVAATVDAMLARWTPRWEANVRTRTADDVDMKAWLQRRAGAALQASTEALRNAAAEAEAARRR